MVALFLCMEGEEMKNDTNSTFEKSDFLIRENAEFDVDEKQEECMKMQ